MANPAFRVIEKVGAGSAEHLATLGGTVKKTAGLLTVTIASAAATGVFLPAIADAAYGILLFSIVAGAVLALVTCFKPQIAEYTSPGYAVFEGIALGIISAVFERQYYGVSAIAVTTTFAVMFVMLFLWKQQIIVATEKFKAVIVSMTAGIAVLYALNMLASIFWTSFLPRSGVVGIGITLAIAGVAAFSLILDFDAIESSVAQGAPKYMEYFNAFTLLITLVWLYLEILKLAKMIMALNDD